MSVRGPFNSRLTSVFLKQSNMKQTVHRIFLCIYTLGSEMATVG